MPNDRLKSSHGSPTLNSTALLPHSKPRKIPPLSLGVASKQGPDNTEDWLKRKRELDGPPSGEELQSKHAY